MGSGSEPGAPGRRRARARRVAGPPPPERDDRGSGADASASPAPAGRNGRPRPVNLALQGGGSHGAFTWGVLDALLEDGRLAFEGIAGASAGAMNAAVMAAGMAGRSDDPAAGGREALASFWAAVSARACFAGGPALAGRTAGGAPAHPWALWFDLFTRLWSPYQFNPLNVDPLREVLEAHVDPARLRSPQAPRLFLCATHVRTGRARVFRNDELSVDALLASAALPRLFQAPRIDGDWYWDGGFSGNPPLFPLHEGTRTRDIVLVQINPLERDGLPDTAFEIDERASEIAFNASLMLEMRSIAFVQRLVDEGRIDSRRYKRVLMHRIADDATLAPLGAASKLDTSWPFLLRLRDAGRAAARRWLDSHFEAVGVRDSVDVAGTYL